jgi:hypothetical protein
MFSNENKLLFSCQAAGACPDLNGQETRFDKFYIRRKWIKQFF